MNIWTDGASSPDGSGGWAWVVSDTIYASGNQIETTNQRMELTAALKALQHYPNDPITIISDSRYLVDCFNQKWYRKWRKNGWKNSKDEPVANQDLWVDLLKSVEGRSQPVRFQWVKGHSGDEGNEMADHLAGEAKSILQQNEWV